MFNSHKNNLDCIKKEVEMSLGKIKLPASTQEKILSKCSELLGKIKKVQGATKEDDLSSSREELNDVENFGTCVKAFQEEGDFKNLTALRSCLEQLKAIHFDEEHPISQSVEEFLEFLKKEVCVFKIAEHIQETLEGLPSDLGYDFSFVIATQEQKDDESMAFDNVKDAIKTFVEWIQSVLTDSGSANSKEAEAILDIFDHLDANALDLELEVRGRIFDYTNKSNQNWEKFCALSREPLFFFAKALFA
ncbi:MAG: hypothetical protein ABIH77_05920 [Pseudomonadota bacterium]